MTCFITINLGTSMTSVVRIFIFIIFAMFLLIPNNSFRISIYMHYFNIPTQAIMVIRSTALMLTLYCISNVICIIYSRQSVLIAHFVTIIAYPNNG